LWKKCQADEDSEDEDSEYEDSEDDDSQDEDNEDDSVKFSLALIDLISEFREEKYFRNTLSRLLQATKTYDPEDSPGIGPILVIIEVICDHVEAGSMITEYMRRVALNAKTWLSFYDEKINDPYLILRDIRMKSFNRLSKIFFEGSLDSLIVKFAASLYFCRDATTDPHCITVLVQIAQ
jgi:hypothetical protein